MMHPNKLLLPLFASLAITHIASAATIPIGTALVIKTTGTISSQDPAGRHFQGQLLQTVAGLPARTTVVGIVESPRIEIGSTTRPLTLKLTQISVRGRLLAIETQSFEAHNSGITGRNGARLTGGAFLLTPGTRLQFRLTKPLDF